MKPILTLLALVCFVFIHAVSAQDGHKKKSKKDKRNSSVASSFLNNVVKLDISHEQISTACSDSSESCKAERLVRIGATALDVGVILFHYRVNAGKIVGKGATVIWDLTDVPPGTYTITAGVLQERFPNEPLVVLGRTQTRTVEILDCAGCPASEKPDHK